MLNTLMVTGHRQLTPPDWTGNPWPQNNKPIQQHHIMLYKSIILWCKTHPEFTNFISGMALGADQLFAHAVLNLRDSNPSIKLHAAVPFIGSELNWPKHSQQLFWNLIDCCNTVTYVSQPPYNPQKMQIRNKYMVDNSHHVLAIWNQTKSGGTYNCLTYATKRGVNISIINPYTGKLSWNQDTK